MLSRSRREGSKIQLGAGEIGAGADIGAVVRSGADKLRSDENRS